MNKYIFVTIFFILLLCINSNLFSQTEDKWTNIDSYENLDGEWEGKAISLVKINNFNTEFVSLLNVSMTFNYKKGDTIVSSIVKYDFADFLKDLENIKEMKENGHTKESIWKIFRGMLENGFFSFDQYSLSYNNSGLASEYFASDSEGDFLINKYRDTLLLIYFKPAFILGIGDSGFTEMIFRKKLTFM